MPVLSEYNTPTPVQLFLDGGGVFTELDLVFLLVMLEQLCCGGGITTCNVKGA